MSRWSNVPGTASIDDICLRGGKWVRSRNVKRNLKWEHEVKPLPDEVQGALTAAFPTMTEDDGVVVEIEFSSSGYFAPGKLSGPPENCYPDEGEDERTLESLTVTDGKNAVTLEGDVAEALFDHFYPEVEAVEVDDDDDGDYDPPDDDDYYDDPAADYIG